SLWSPREVQTRDKGSSQARTSSRVPAVRALHLTWGFPMETLLRKAAIELWMSSQVLEVQGLWRTTSPG
ncbi:unnamed protein product, partial [Ectocarpus sp. 4 AP-2014]